MSRNLISRWEKQPLFDDIKTKKATPDSLVFFFKQHGIIFPDENTVKFESSDQNNTSNHLTRFQLRASRAALGLTQEKLSQLTTLSKADINYLETYPNNILLNCTNKTVNDILLKTFLEEKGIKFPDIFTIKITSA